MAKIEDVHPQKTLERDFHTVDCDVRMGNGHGRRMAPGHSALKRFCRQ
jgi:hypothetical protein